MNPSSQNKLRCDKPSEIKLYGFKYKYLLFDVDNTLFDYTKGERYALESSFGHFGINYNFADFAVFYATINHQIWSEFERKEITSVKLRVERFKRLFMKLDMNIDAADFSEFYLNQLGETAYLLDGALDMLNSIPAQYELALITNGLKDTQISRLNKSVIQKFFSKITISEDVPNPKPHEDIFIEAMRKFGNPDKSEVIIIGDSLSSDIQGGINFGIDTCWFNPEKTENTSSFIPTYTIHNLMDFLNII